MKKLSIILVGLLSLGISFSYQNFINKNINGHKVKLIQVILDKNHQVVVSLSNKGEKLKTLMENENGLSAVNGAYFCPKDYENCNGKDSAFVPRFYRGKNYSLYKNDFGINGVFAFDKDGKPFIVMNQLWGNSPEQLKNIKYNADKINNIYFGLGNFPVLLLDGENIVKKYGNEITEKMKQKGYKSFICYTKDKKTIYMGYVSNISMYDLPDFIKNNFECYGAINLDSGASLGMIYNNKTIRKNRRGVMDAFVVVDKNKEQIKQKAIKKYDKLIDKIVNKIKKMSYYKQKSILSKISTLKYKFNNKPEIFAVLNEIEVRYKLTSN